MLPQGLLSDDQQRNLNRRAWGAAIADGMMAFAGGQGSASENLAQQRQQMEQGLLAQHQAEQQRQMMGDAIDGYVQQGIIQPHQAAMFRANPGALEHFLEQHYTRRTLSPGQQEFTGAGQTFGVPQANVTVGNRVVNPQTGEVIFEQPASELVFGQDIDSRLPGNVPFQRGADGTLAPLNLPQDPDRINALLQAQNNYQTQSRDNSNRLRAAEVALNSIGPGMSDFDTTQAIMNWINTMGGRARIGTEGELVDESGLFRDIARRINEMRGGGQITPEQQSALSQTIQTAVAPVIRQQQALDQEFQSMLPDLGYQGDVQQFPRQVWDPSAFQDVINKYGLEPRR